MPETTTTILECPSPAPKPTSPVFPSFGLFAPNEIPIVVNMQEFAWLLARNLSSQRQANDELPLEERNEDFQEERGPCSKQFLCGQPSTRSLAALWMSQKWECRLC